MNLNQFLAELTERGIKLWLEGDALCFRAPKGVIAAEDRDLLLLHKPEIISLLFQNDANADDTDQNLAPILEGHGIPLSFAQKQLWLLSQLDSNNHSYNELFALRLLGSLNITALEESLNKIVARHAVLRTNFSAVNGQPVQVIAESLILKVPVINLADLSAIKREIEVQRLAAAQAQKPFDLVSDPLFQAVVLKLTETEHVLFLKIHHIVWDASSFSILLKELADFYSAFCNDSSPELPPLSAQYSNFAVWQRQWIAEGVIDSQQAYWKQQLLDAPALLELPIDRPRGDTQSFRGAHQRFTISKELSEALVNLSRRQRVTLFMTLLATFQTLLYRYTGQTDICVGSPIANRDRTEFKELIGFFVNTLVLRTCLSDNPSFEDLLSRVRKVTLESYDHRDLPFEKLVEILQPVRSLSHAPLVQAMLVLLNELPTTQTHGLKISPLAIETGMARLDLCLCVEETKSGLIGEWEYNTDLFNAATIVRMSSHFQTLLESIVASPDKPISELPLLREAEQQQLLVEWNDTQTEYPQDKCIHQLFEEQVERTPNAIAVIFENKHLTYRELNKQANQLAHYLRTLGVGSEVLVGICVERSLEMLVGILGILKAGGAYVPLDPAYPQERLAYMLQDSAVSVLLTKSHLNEHLPTHLAQVVYLDKDSGDIAQHSEHNLTLKLTANNLAYVIYTSGSTGKPKGVLLEHKGLCNLAIDQQHLFGINSDSRVLQFASLSFDVSVWEIFMALTAGASLVLASQDALMPGLPLLKLLQRQSITMVALPPSALAVLPVERLPALQTIVVGGEACSTDLITCWAAERQFVNAYGPTESTVCATVSPSNSTAKLSIGRPIANVQVYILDSHLQPVPIGVSGELYIGGDGLARGYLNRPDLTAEKFILNPFSIESNSRLYKTGDLARYLPGGNIELIGRIDHQVKIRGFRIELGEIESTLIQHPDVREAVVVAREDKPGDKRLVAYITSNLILDRLPYQSECLLELHGNTFKLQTADISRGGVEVVATPMMVISEGTSIRLRLLLPGSSETQWFNGQIAWSQSAAAGIKLHLTPVEQVIFSRSLIQLQETQGLWKTWQRSISTNLRNYLKGKLPSYMMPSAFVLLNAMPLTPNGKIDRRALPIPLITTQKSEKTSENPQTLEEKILIQVWREVLQAEEVGIHDNFFELGGDSIRSMQIISRAIETGIQITPKQIFQYQTIAELAAVVSPKRFIQAEQGAISGSISLTPIQQWFFEQNLPKPDHFNQAFLLEFFKEINSNLLQQAIEQLLSHHDVLRLQFTQIESTWQQVNLLPEQKSNFSIVDLSTLSAIDQRVEIEARSAKLQADLDISTGLIAKFVLFNLGIDRASRLLIIIHHLAVDGISWRILLEDLQTVYRQLETNQLIRLPSKTTSFKCWAERLVDYTRSNLAEQQLEYWLRMSNKPIVSSPLDFELQINTVSASRTLTLSLNTEETSALLQQVPKTYQTQINDVLLTALVQVLANWCGSHHIRIDLEGHGREDILSEVDLSRTVGWFTSVFPILLNLSASDNSGEVLRSIRDQLRLVPNRGISYGLLRYLSGDSEIIASLQSVSQAEICFNYLGQFDWGAQPNDLFRLSSEPIGLVQSPDGLRTYLIDVNSMVIEGQLQIEWTYSKNIHKTSTIERLAKGYVENLRSLITHCLAAEPQEVFFDNLATTLPSITPVLRDKPIPLSFCQYDFWQYECEIEALSSTNTAANDVIVLRFNGVLSELALEKSLNEIIHRHEILRTAFVVVNNQPTQVILSTFNLTLEKVYLETYALEERVAEAEKSVNQLIRSKFSLTSGVPAIRARLLRISSEEHWLSIVTHHIINDAWSSSLFHQELELLYDAFLNNLPSPLPVLPIQYADFSHWQNQYLTQQVLPKQLAYWKQKLSALPGELDFLPLQSTIQDQSKEPYASYSIVLPTELMVSVQIMSNSQGFTISTIILAALNILLSQWSSKKDIVLSMASSNRKTPILEKILGCFTNEFFLVARVSKSKTIIEILEEVQQSVNEAILNQDIPITQVMKASNLESLRTIGVSVAPSLEKKVQNSVFESLEISTSPELFDKKQFPIDLYISINGTAVELSAHYCTDTFTGEGIKQFFENLQEILSKIVDSSNLTISEIFE